MHCPLAFLLVLVTLPAAQAVAEPLMEKRILFGPDSARQWSASESTMETSSHRTRTRAAALRWHITADHFGGEAKYPIGWPRVSIPLAEPSARDWSGWDYLQLWVYTETSRDALPREPAGLILHTPDKEGAFHRPLGDLKRNEWVQIRFPLAQVPRHQDVRLMQFNISDARYRHQDQLDCYFDEIALLRYAHPTLLEFAAENAVMFTGAKQVPLRFNLAGVKPGESLDVICELKQGAKVIAQAKVKAVRGRQGVAFGLSAAKLNAGEYALEARATGGMETATARVRLVESPWK